MHAVNKKKSKNNPSVQKALSCPSIETFVSQQLSAYEQRREGNREGKDKK